MMSGFKRYNIEHLSPSSLNLFLSQPAAWVLRYVVKATDNGPSPAAWRGTAVEAGMTALLLGSPRDAALTAAHTNYDLNAAGHDGVEDERAIIAPMLDRVADTVATWPRPVSTQRRVSVNYGDSMPPIIGFLDYEMPDHVVDLKTTKALPSSPRPDHVRQAALYARATNLPVRLMYVTPKKVATYEVTPEQVAEGWGQLVKAASALELVLHTFFPQQLATIYVPDFDHYVWNDQLKEQWNVFAKK